MLLMPLHVQVVQVPPAAERLAVRIDTAEAEAVLAILDLRPRGEAPSEADWTRLFATEGYRRLKRREAALNRAFDDADFRTFVQSEALLERAPALRRALAGWRTLDPAPAARRALAYLPSGARIRATIYPVIKPKENSFVFEVETDPAIFMYLDPSRSPAKEENTLTHELHHIGYGTLPRPEESGLPEPLKLARTFTGAFGEGFAMLAAAGGPQVHPHATSSAEDRERWDRDVARFPEDFQRLLAFFQRILDGSLKEEAATKEGMAFFGVQGPWYTVGWRMATLIETRLGKDRLLSVFQNLPTLYRTWNEAAADEEKAGGPNLPRWPQAFVEAIEQAPPKTKSAAQRPRSPDNGSSLRP